MEGDCDHEWGATVIRRFVLSSTSAGGYLGTVSDTGRVSLQAFGGAMDHPWYKRVENCYEALCGKGGGYTWRTLERDE